MIIENAIILRAEEGMVLTNGKDFLKVAQIGKNDNKDNWHEITDEEAEEMQTAELEEVTE
jgi:hypothetical protein